MKNNNEVLEKLVSILPSSEANLRRLFVLNNAPKEPRIAVFGKYNHGKSTLLNALIKEEVFKTADKRETVEISEHLYNGVVWIDTPGLDADIAGEDDKKAKKAAFEIADILFLVHNVSAGELDRDEKKIYEQLMRQDKNYRKKMVLVLTQIDQVDENDLERVINEVTKQIPDLQICPVSAQRYIRGVNEEKEAFINKSRMNGLVTLLDSFKKDIDQLRLKEIKRLKAKARIELNDRISAAEKDLNSVKHQQKESRKIFLLDVKRIENKILKHAESIGLN